MSDILVEKFENRNLWVLMEARSLRILCVLDHADMSYLSKKLKEAGF